MSLKQSVGDIKKVNRRETGKRVVCRDEKWVAGIKNGWRNQKTGDGSRKRMLKKTGCGVKAARCQNGWGVLKIGNGA